MPNTKKPKKVPYELTERQTLVKTLHDKGLDKPEIASQLNITPTTVKDDLRAIKDKELRKARAAGKIPPEVKTKTEVARDTARQMNTPAQRANMAKVRTTKILGKAKNGKGPNTTVSTLELMENARLLALNMMDKTVLSAESGVGLSRIVGTLTDKIQILKGEPTVITRVEDVRKTDELLKRIDDELARRQMKQEEKVIN